MSAAVERESIHKEWGYSKENAYCTVALSTPFCRTQAKEISGSEFYFRNMYDLTVMGE